MSPLRALAPGEALQAAELLSPRIEAEIAFRLGTDLCGTGVVKEAARGAMAEVSRRWRLSTAA